MEIFLVAFAIFGMGMFVTFLGLTLFSEYRKAFMANPMAMMTLDVFLAAMERGGPALLAVMAIFGGALTAASGVILLVFLLVYETGPLWRAILIGLGF